MPCISCCIAIVLLLIFFVIYFFQNCSDKSEPYGPSRVRGETANPEEFISFRLSHMSAIELGFFFIY